MEDRNDLLVQKMKRYINAFSKDGESAKEMEETGKSDSGNDPTPESYMARTKSRSHKCWQLIRQSIECEKEENVDSPDFKYI